MAIKIFVSYAHKDEELEKEMREFFVPQIRSGEIELWDDFQIDAGDAFMEKIVAAIESAQIVLCLLSPAFLASEFIEKHEVAAALKQAEQKKTRVVPIMLRPCNWAKYTRAESKYQLKDLHGLPRGMKPVVSFALRDDAWMEIVTHLQRTIDSLKP